jgi:hypothetical protein
LGLPARAGGDYGLADVRRDIAWVLARLRAGNSFPTHRWRLEDVLAAARNPRRRFFCFTYSSALVSVAESQGYPARPVELGDHITAEVFLPALDQWVMADAIYDFIPFGPDGRPLSVLDVHRRVASGAPIAWERVVGVRGDDDELEGRTQAKVEALLRAGDFVVKDAVLNYALGDGPAFATCSPGDRRVAALRLTPAANRRDRRHRGPSAPTAARARWMLAPGAAPLVIRQASAA